jgi:hypothetical protein
MLQLSLNYYEVGAFFNDARLLGAYITMLI